MSNPTSGYALARELAESTAPLDDDASASTGAKQQSEYVAQGRERAKLPTESLDYRQAMERRNLELEKVELEKKIAEAQGAATTTRKRRRWDEAAPEASAPAAPALVEESDASEAHDDKPLKRGASSRWDQTPQQAAQAAPAAAGKRSRWDQTTPLPPSAVAGATAAPPLAAGAAAAAPAAPALMTQQATTQQRWQKELSELNRPWTDAELDAMMPSEGYEVCEPPDGYAPNSKRQSVLSAPEGDLVAGRTEGFIMADTINKADYGINLQRPDSEQVHGAAPSDLPFIKQDEMQFFGRLLDPDAAAVLDREQVNDRLIMELLLKIKNGLPSVRKVAMRQITDEAPRLGAGALFNQILPLLMSPSLEEQERHLLVKVIDRILFRLGDAVRPFTHKILAVIEPLLIDEDYFARVEGREIIANLSKAVGLATMIATMRPDIDNPDEFVRNTTARAFAVVASALGVPSMAPFLRAVCRSKRSWHARHTGIKIIQQVSILLGCGILPHLSQLVECVAPGVKDEQQKVRTMAALSLAALAEASHPYGYESFEPILESLWEGIAKHRGKGLAAFLKAVGFIIPLMDETDAARYTKRVMPILVREFKSPDEETKKIVLRAVKQCATTHGVTAQFLREEVLGAFFESFWIRRMALDKRNHEFLVDTTLTLASRVGAGEVLELLVADLKDDSEPYRRMVMDAVERILKKLGASDVKVRLEERLVDGALFAFQEQDGEDTGGVMLRGFVGVVDALGVRAKPYLAQIAATAKWRIQNKSPQVRMQASDLIAGLGPCMRLCGEEELLGHLGVILYENLGEEYPDVLGSLLGALKSVVVSLGVDRMTPPIRDLLPRLTPILKNTNEKVTENLIDLVGRIADLGAQHVSAREWMRICFDLLEMLRSPRMSIRRAAVSTFGMIARAVGPQDVLHTLLNNLRVQERQMRVCTTVAIAIVAETCAPFTVLPGLMNEYRAPDNNVQHGVLKALSFMLQYIRIMASDYVYALTPLIQHALSDRDHVHRQTAADAVKHLALGVAGRGCEDSLAHLLNYVFPSIFEQSPHVARAVLEAVEALRVGLGPGRVVQYLYPGLFHPARFVRQVYWRLYNNVYVGDSDALVPCYPRFENVPNGLLGQEAQPAPHLCKRTHFDLFV